MQQFNSLASPETRSDEVEAARRYQYADCMHKIGRGAMGHICVTTTDVDGAMAHLASKGVEFIDETKKFDEQGHCTFVYLKGELSGFAFHLQKAR